MPDQPNASRRRFLGGTVAGAGLIVTAAAAPSNAFAARPQEPAVAAEKIVDGIDPGQLPQVDSTFFSTAFIEHAGSYAAPGSDGDLWPTCWADDDNLYTANGDGRGFSDEPFKDVVVNRISGTPETGLTGVKLAESAQVANVWGDPAKYNRKPTGMVCVNETLYLAVQDLRYGDNAFDDVPNASISRSDDHGKTWHKTEQAMFTDHRFTTIFFIDFGKNSEHATRALGRRDGSYVYAYGMDWNWRLSGSGTVPDPVDLYLGRVPAGKVQDRTQWEFFTGTDRHGSPTWNRRIEKKVPVLHDPLRRYLDTRPGKSGNLTVVSQGGVLYNAPLKRYLYSSWSDPSFELYESPTPWGPWRRFHYHNTGLVPWYQQNDKVHTPKNGGYGTTMPSKYVSADGRSLWMQTNWWTAPYPKPEDNYNFNLRRVRLEPHREAAPANRPAPTTNLARTVPGVTPHEICAFSANWKYYNDGDRTKSETSDDGTNKNIDYWGYVFPTPYWMSRLEYTTGTMEAAGGWFSAYGDGLKVQVRQNFRWIDVDNLAITPDYPFDATAGPYKTYQLRFRPIWGDGVRVIGQPGGTSHFTSIAELEVYFG
jgi:hypothetical protein